MTSPNEQFLSIITTTLGVNLSAVAMDGAIHRFALKPNGKDKNGWYCGYSDGLAAGSFGSWQTGESHTWCSKSDIELTTQERESNKQRFQEAANQRELERAKVQKEAATKAASFWQSASDANENHPYLVNKGIKSHGLRQSRDALVVPVRIAGELTSLQFISGDGSKKFLTGGALKAGYYSIAATSGDKNTIVICEGIATAASVHKACGYGVAVAFNAGNLEPVAKALLAKLPNAKLIIACDDDYQNEINTGLTKAQEAANAVNGVVALPPFNRDNCETGSDWNDYHSLHGLDKTQEAFETAIAGVPLNQPKPAQSADKTPRYISYGVFHMCSEGLTIEVEKGRGDSKTTVQETVSSAFEILGKSRTGTGSNWGLWLHWQDADKRTHTKLVSSASIHGEPSTLCQELAKDGLYIALGKQRALASYLNSAHVQGRVTTVDRTGWHNIAGNKVFVLPQETIGRLENETVILESISHSPYAQAGTLDQWKAGVTSLAQGHVIPVLAISTALAGVLLGLCNSEGGGVHFYGTSSRGKTTVLQMAASVWGKGSNNGFVRPWRATANALEGAAALASDTALILDEMGVLEVKEAQSAIYALTNGAGKGRSNRNGDVRENKSWRVMVVSSGEIPLEAKLSEGKGKARAGQLIRLIDLPADRGNGYGVFDHAGLTGDASELANAIKQAAQTNYGTAGAEFVRAILAEGESEVAQLVLEEVALFVQDVCPAGSDGQVQRAASRLGIIAAAGELASLFGITGWQKDEALNAAKWAFNQWLESRGGCEPAEVSQAIEQVRGFIEAHGDARFESLDFPPDRPYPNRAGYRKGSGDSREWIILPTTWSSEICNGLDSKFVAKALDAKGMIRRQADKMQCVVKIAGSTCRAYVVTSKIFAGG
jgi:phage/plasmid primase-like uncharacterized protein/uncharacterized protein (DUF927 family)